MALWFVTQIVENNYSVCRQQCKAEIALTASFSSPALEVATVGNGHICTEGRAPGNVKTRRSRAKSHA